MIHKPASAKRASDRTAAVAGILMVGQQSHPEKPYGDLLARARVNPSYFGAPLA